MTGTSVHRFLVGRRVREAQRLLVVSDVKTSCMSQEVGFRSATRPAGTSNASPA